MTAENSFCRYAYPGDASPRHVTDVGKCSAVVFFRVFHFWNRRSTTLGRNPSTALRTGAPSEREATQVCTSLITLVSYIKK